MSEQVAAAGAGRMGRGLAIVFAYAGHTVSLVDLKAREDAAAYLENARAEIRRTLEMLVVCGLLEPADVDRIAARVLYLSEPEADAALAAADLIFEGAPETLEAKRDVLQRISRAAPDAVIASTTSTMLSDTLQGFVDRPERFLNAHWLNPAYLMPLVEVSPGAETAPEVTDGLVRLLEGIGKTPVVCRASPGFIVPRIQALAMNEAARLYEEGVASAEDIDKATKFGFGLRFAVLGLLEFIDWGGGDILHYASRYMADATGEARFEAPEVVSRNMAEGRTGLRAGVGFRDYREIDVDAYQRRRLASFVEMLKHLDVVQPPK